MRTETLILFVFNLFHALMTILKRLLNANTTIENCAARKKLLCKLRRLLKIYCIVMCKKDSLFFWKVKREL